MALYNMYPHRCSFVSFLSQQPRKGDVAVTVNGKQRLRAVESILRVHRPGLAQWGFHAA